MPRKSTTTLAQERVGIRLSSHEKLCAERMLNIQKSIERLERKIGLLTIQPYELHCYFLSLIESSKLLKIISKDKKLKYINKNNIHNKIDVIIKKSNEIFDYEKLSIINFSKEFQISFFKKGYDSKIDNLVSSMDLGHTFLEKLLI